MSWHDGPLQSWYDVHEALLKDIARVRTAARQLNPETLSTFTEQLQFFLDVLQVHSLHEDGVAFPFMEAHGIQVPASIRTEHHQESALLYDIRCALTALHALPEYQEEGIIVARVNAQLATLEEHLLAHITFEDSALIPQFEQGLELDLQKKMINRLVGETPTWIAPKLMGWMFSNISAEHGIHLLGAWLDFLPADVFAKKAAGIRAGVSPERWQWFVDQLPELEQSNGE